MNIGPLEIGIVIVIALLIFGAKKLPELGGGLGRGMREFKDGVLGDKDAGASADASESVPQLPAAEAERPAAGKVPTER